MNLDALGIYYEWWAFLPLVSDTCSACLYSFVSFIRKITWPCFDEYNLTHHRNLCPGILGAFWMPGACSLWFWHLSWQCWLLSSLCYIVFHWSYLERHASYCSRWENMHLRVGAWETISLTCPVLSGAVV